MIQETLTDDLKQRNKTVKHLRMKLQQKKQESRKKEEGMKGRVQAARSQKRTMKKRNYGNE